MSSRYNKQLILSEFGIENQDKIKNIKVLIIGIGGIGCPVVTYLSSMGFENIGIVDHDIVELSNLHRQFIYKEGDIGLLKVDCAEKFCKKRNSNVKIIKYADKLTNKNTIDLLLDYDIIVDCTDNIFTRYTVNDACVLLGKAYIFGSAIETSGQIGIFNYMGSPCLRCIYPQVAQNTCETTGVLGVIPGIIGDLLALEIVKLVCNFDGLLVNKLLTYDLYHGFNTINISKKNDKCLVCSNNSNNNAITISNYANLDIYHPSCVIKNDCLFKCSSNESIYIEANSCINDLYEKYINQNNTIKLVFDCEKKIISKLLVHKLRQNGHNNSWILE